jgi:hypothetical protein
MKATGRIIGIFVCIALMGAWISNAAASGLTFDGPITVSPVPGPVPGAKELDRDDWHEAVRLEDAEQPARPARPTGLACIIAARTWGVDEAVCGSRP